MVHHASRSVVLCVIVLDVFVTRTVFRSRSVAPVVQGGSLSFVQSGASRFSVQNEFLFSPSSVHTQSPSTSYDMDSFDKRRHQQDVSFLWFDLLYLRVSEAHFCESTCLEGQ